METKILEIRDRMTYIPVMATQMVSAGKSQAYYLHRHGWPTGASGPLGVVLARIDNVEAHGDPYEWAKGGCRTMTTAHEYIITKFDTLKDGDVVDVEFILGESQQPKRSESEARNAGTDT